MAKNPIALLWGWIGPGDQDYQRVGAISDGDKYRLMTAGKVVVTPPAPPSGATEVVIDNSDPLYLGPVPLYEEVAHDIPAGKTFHLQFISAGAAGDPAEKGALVTVSYNDGTQLHVIERVFVQSNTTALSFDDITLTRDGTTMAGGAGKQIVLRREQLSKAGECDAVVRGYEQ